MSEVRKKYSREFKIEAVHLITEGGHKVALVEEAASAAENMAAGAEELRSLMRQFRVD